MNLRRINPVYWLRPFKPKIKPLRSEPKSLKYYSLSSKNRDRINARNALTALSNLAINFSSIPSRLFKAFINIFEAEDGD
jgi:hypothetical protein